MPKAVVIRSFVMNHIVHHRGQIGVCRREDVHVPSIIMPRTVGGRIDVGDGLATGARKHEIERRSSVFQCFRGLSFSRSRCRETRRCDSVRAPAADHRSPPSSSRAPAAALPGGKPGPVELVGPPKPRPTIGRSPGNRSKAPPVIGSWSSTARVDRSRIDEDGRGSGRQRGTAGSPLLLAGTGVQGRPADLESAVTSFDIK